MKIWRRLGAVLGAAVLTVGGTAIALASNANVNGASGQALSAPADQGCGVEPLDVELILDVSGSMGSNSSNGHTRLYWAQQAAEQLVGDLDAAGGVGSYHMVGLTRFSGTSASVVRALSGGFDASNIDAAIAALTATGNTPLKAGMAAGAADLASVSDGHQHVIILLSDGRPNPDQSNHNGVVASDPNTSQRPDQANLNSYLASADVAISVAVGTGGSTSSAIDLGLMGLLGPDGAYHVVNGDELGNVFASIYTQIACPTEQPPTEQPPTEQPPTEQPPTEQPPTEQPPTEQPPTEQPPTEQPPTATPSFFQTVEAATDIPTEPNTATVGGDGTSGPADGSWLLVAALGVLLASVVVLTPARVKNRR